MFTLNNTDIILGSHLRPLSGPWSFFRRMRILVAGQLVEDIDQYNRIHEMMSFLVAHDSNQNDAAEAFGIIHDKHVLYNMGNWQGIQPGQSLPVLFTPLSGLLRQNKMIPLRYAPVTIELELVDNYTDPAFTGYTRDFANSAVPLQAVGGQRYRNGKIIYSVANQQRPSQNRRLRLRQRVRQLLRTAFALR